MDRIVLMVKDPWWLYAYWEIQPDTERAARGGLLPEEVAGLQRVLRVSDVTGIAYPDKEPHRSFDISLSGLATNWYVQTDAPGREFVAEIGLLANTGRFLSMARSNRVTAPPAGPSTYIDKSWEISDEDFAKIINISVGGTAAATKKIAGCSIL